MGESAEGDVFNSETEADDASEPLLTGDEKIDDELSDYDGTDDKDEDEEDLFAGNLESKANNGTVNNRFKDEAEEKQRGEAIGMFMSEMDAGDTADLIGQNHHIEQSHVYYDLGRRSVQQDLKSSAAENVQDLIPEKASPALVLLVAKESALLGPDKDTDFNRNKILRSGDYWNRVWKEEIKRKSARRAPQQKGKIKKILTSEQKKKILPQLLIKLRNILNKKPH